MVNTTVVSRRRRVQAMSVLVRSYVAIVLGTVVALAVLTVTAPAQATRDAWVHAVIVAVFAVLLPLRLRSARSRSRGGLRAVGLISAALFLVNVVEAMIPGLFPLWLRVVMVGIAVLMAAVVGLAIREALTDPHS
jgi:peptidoglycan/LPS O-acetylase OafA/YrhL